MVLTVKTIEMPLLGATKDESNPKAVARFVNPLIGDWFVIEGEPMENGDIMFFGFARLLDEEYGSFTLAQLLSVGAVLDDEFAPMRMSEAKKTPLVVVLQVFEDRNPQTTSFKDRDKMEFSDVLNHLSDDEKETLMEIGFNYLKSRKEGVTND